MDPITFDGLAEQQLLGDVDRGRHVLRGLPAGASRPIRATRRLRRIVSPVRNRLVPVVLGLVVAALALVFSLTGSAFAIFLLVPSALLAWLTWHAVATSTPRAAPQVLDKETALVTNSWETGKAGSRR
jgi:hypothetical protein